MAYFQEPAGTKVLAIAGNWDNYTFVTVPIECVMAVNFMGTYMTFLPSGNVMQKNPRYNPDVCKGINEAGSYAAYQKALADAAEQEMLKAQMLASPTAQFAPAAPVLYNGYTIAQNAQKFFMVTSPAGVSLGGFDTLDQAKARVDQAVGNTTALNAPTEAPGTQAYRNYAITLEGNRYIVTSPTGRELGIYTSLTDAQKAVDSDIAAGNISAPIPPTQNGGQVVTQADVGALKILPPGTGGIINPGAAPTITQTPPAPGECAPFDILCQAKNLIGIPIEGDKRTVQCPQDPSKNVNQVYQNGSWVTVSTDVNVCAAPTLEGNTRTKKCPNDDKITITQKYTNGEWVTIDADKNKCSDDTLLAGVIILVAFLAILAILARRK